MTQPIQTVEWECDTVRLVRLDGLPRGINPFQSKRGRKVEEVVVDAMGQRLEGMAQVLDLAAWAVTPRGSRGGGGGMPGVPAHFVVPGVPALENGRFVVYRVWDDAVCLRTAAGVHDAAGVRIVMGGWMASRYAPSALVHDGADATALECLGRLVLDFLMPRYGLKASPATLLGGFDCGRPSSPGDAVEAWIRSVRGELVAELDEGAPGDRRLLNTWALRQAALVELGYDPGEVDGVQGLFTRAAVAAFQRSVGLVADGVWGPRTEGALRVALMPAET